MQIIVILRPSHCILKAYKHPYKTGGLVCHYLIQMHMTVEVVKQKSMGGANMHCGHSAEIKE